MALEQYHYRVMIVSLSEKFNSEIGSLLQDSFTVDSVDCAASAGEARRSRSSTSCCPTPWIKRGIRRSPASLSAIIYRTVSSRRIVTGDKP